MAIEGDIKTLLSPLVDGKCYPVTLPEGIEAPYIIYRVVSNVPVVTLNGSSGLSKKRVQIDVWADTYTEQKEIEKLVFAAMENSELSNIPLIATDLYEEETKLFRSLMEFSIGGLI